MISTMHTKAEVEESITAKPEIIKFYNATKGGVDNMDKLLSEYSVQRRTKRWPLALFYNMLNISALAAYIIYHEHNNTATSTNRRRKFLQELSLHLCMPLIERRVENPNVMGNPSTRMAIELVLGKEPSPKKENANPERDLTGRLPQVGICHLCKTEGNQRRKTRKTCKCCLKPVCKQHCKDVCNDC